MAENPAVIYNAVYIALEFGPEAGIDYLWFFWLILVKWVCKVVVFCFLCRRYYKAAKRVHKLIPKGARRRSAYEPGERVYFWFAVVLVIRVLSLIFVFFFGAVRV